MFSCEFCEISKNTFSTDPAAERLQTTASAFSSTLSLFFCLSQFLFIFFLIDWGVSAPIGVVGVCWSWWVGGHVCLVRVVSGCVFWVWGVGASISVNGVMGSCSGPIGAAWGKYNLSEVHL